MQVLSVSPSKVASDGGYALDITGTDFPLGIPLTVHIGGTGTADDPKAYSGRAGQGTQVFALTKTRIRVWTGLLHPGSSYQVLVVSPTATALLNDAFTAVSNEYRTGIFSLRSVLPPMWRTGPRSIIDALVIEDDAPAALIAHAIHFDSVLGDGGSFLANDGAGTWVVVGRDKGFVSANRGVTWAASYNDSADTTKYLRGAAWTGQKFLAVYYHRGSPAEHIVKYSTDGATWLSTTIANAATDSEQIYDLTSDGLGTVIAVGKSGVIYRSTNHGLTWTRIESGNFNGDCARVIWNAALSLFVVIGGDTIRTSANGASWATRSVGALTDTLHLIDQNSSGRMVVGSSGDNTLLVSANGVSWSSVPTSVGEHLDIKFIGDFFWKCGAQVAKSPDGTVWTAVPSPGGYAVQIAGLRELLFVTLDVGGIVKSANFGVTWQSVFGTAEVVDDFQFDPLTYVAVTLFEAIGTGARETRRVYRV